MERYHIFCLICNYFSAFPHFWGWGEDELTHTATKNDPVCQEKEKLPTALLTSKYEPPFQLPVGKIFIHANTSELPYYSFRTDEIHSVPRTTQEFLNKEILF